MKMKIVRQLMAIFLFAGLTQNVIAASQEMGTGTPEFGIYSQFTSIQVRVWSLTNATVPFAAGCTYLILDPAVVGMDTYKIDIATMTAAKLSGKRVRFYAHGEHNGGCGVDYVQLTD